MTLNEEQSYAIPVNEKNHQCVRCARDFKDTRSKCSRGEVHLCHVCYMEPKFQSMYFSETGGDCLFCNRGLITAEAYATESAARMQPIMEELEEKNA